MQITFDPFNRTECEAVTRFMSHASDLTREQLGGTSHQVYSSSTAVAHVAKVLAENDRPDVGADAPSAAPLQQDPYLQGIMDRAPSTAAAALFSTVPAAPSASVPPAPPVPQPPVPAAPVSAPAPSASVLPVIPAGDVDKAGLPWDERIHASTKTKNADGTWRQRRGLNDAALLKRVEEELRARVAPLAGAPIATQTGDATSVPGTANAPTVSAPNVPPAPSAGAANVVPPAPPVTPPAVPVPPAPAGAASPAIPTAPPVPGRASTVGQPLDVGGFFKMLTENVASGQLLETTVHEILAEPSVGLRPEQIGVLAGDAAKRQIVADAIRTRLGL